MRCWRKFLPRSNSKVIFLFAVSSYGIALTSVLARVVAVLHLWPHTVSGASGSSNRVSFGVTDGTELSDFFVFPILETLLLAGLIELMQRLRFGWRTTGITTTALLCAAHGVHWPIWAMLVVPSFSLQTLTYLYWKRAASIRTALLMVVALHFCLNGIPFLTALGRNFF
jgi:hypothetical protein